MPPLMRIAALPPVPTGIPPAPCSGSPWTYAPKSRISTRTVTSGSWTFTVRLGKASSRHAPTSAEISGDESGNFLSARLVSTLKVRTVESCGRRYSTAAARTASMLFSVTQAREKVITPKILRTRSTAPSKSAPGPGVMVMVDCAMRTSNSPSGARRRRMFLIRAFSNVLRFKPLRTISPSLSKMTSFIGCSPFMS